ncbi:retrovirus-related pol polyprotein from transposon TNT 1-94 [Tanacetum coccineum]
MKTKESLNVTFDETPPPSKTSPLVDDYLDEEKTIKVTEKKNLEKDIEDETLEIDEVVNIKESRNHSLENVIGNLNQRTLRSQAQNQSNFFCFISTIEPKNVNETLTDESWIIAMQEELNQFIANDVWELVPQPKNMTIIGTKWVFRNKLDKNGVISRNKTRLVAQGYNQQEGIDYDETYGPVARLESIRKLLAYTCTLDFNLFQMDVKSAFLNGFINEEVYVAQPPGFIDFVKPDHVYKLKKALYGLKQAPKVWYDRPKAFLIKHGYKIGMDSKTSHLEAVKRIFRYIKDTPHLGLWYPKGTGIETVVYADSDHAGDYVDKKSTSSIFTFVGCCLTSWFPKKQTALTISTTEAEYVNPYLYLQYMMSGDEPAPQMAQVESPQMISTIKLHILKKGKYTLWYMRMKQYLTNTDYGLWQVIMNGDEPVQTTKDKNGVETEVPPKTAQAILARQKERKTKSILLLAIPDEY